MPAGSLAPVLSFIGVAPETLQRPLPRMYVIPAGSASVICRLVAAAVPELVYDRVTVIGPALGDGPLFCVSAFVTVTTEAATVVVSVFVRIVGVESWTDTVMVAVSPFAAAAGTVPATTKRKMPPAVIGPVVLIGVALSGIPSPFASM